MSICLLLAARELDELLLEELELLELDDLLDELWLDRELRDDGEDGEDTELREDLEDDDLLDELELLDWELRLESDESEDLLEELDLELDEDCEDHELDELPGTLYQPLQSLPSHRPANSSL
jgi:hypothetical protein